MHTDIQTFIDSLDPTTIDQDRYQYLDPIVDYLKGKHQSGDPIIFNAICTHNSRRSQFTQVWADVFARLNGITVDARSGGVEVTACNFRVIYTLRNLGFKINNPGLTNPHMAADLGDGKDPIRLFSKLYDHQMTDGEKMLAVMVCGHADENCPIIPSADARMPLRYVDPKISDDTPSESETYLARCRQIATEMQYVFGKVVERA